MAARSTPKKSDPAAALDAERDRIAARVAALEAELAEAIANADARTAPDPDASDAGSGDVERDRVTALLIAAREGLAQVDAAARRAAAGAWGICASCGKAISPERLAALPTATTCVQCARPGLSRGFRR